MILKIYSKKVSYDRKITCDFKNSFKTVLHNSSKLIGVVHISTYAIKKILNKNLFRFEVK